MHGFASAHITTRGAAMDDGAAGATSGGDEYACAASVVRSTSELCTHRMSGALGASPWREKTHPRAVKPARRHACVHARAMRVNESVRVRKVCVCVCACVRV